MFHRCPFVLVLSGLVVVCISVPLVADAHAQRPSIFEAFFTDDGRKAGCFVRRYTDVHLGRHPNQRVREMLLTPAIDGMTQRRSGFRLDMHVRSRATGETGSRVAYCSAHGDGSARCSLEGDGGRIVLTFTGSGQLRVKVRRIGIEGRTGVFEFGRGISDDEVFLLDLIDHSACVMRKIDMTD